MTETVNPAPAAAPAPAAPTITQAPLPADSIIIPTHNTEGRVLTARERFQNHALQNPTFVRDFATPGTPAAALKAQLDQDMLREATQSTEGAPQTRPEEYVLPYPGGLEGSLSPEQQQFDMQARGWLQAAGLSAQEGTSLASLLNERADHWATQPAESWERAGDETEQLLRGIVGERYDATLEDANALIAEVELTQPGLRRWLAETGLTNDAQTIVALANLRRRQAIGGA